MSTELLVPIDKYTGLPHPFLPYESPNHPDAETNFDHTFFPRTAPELQDAGGMAVRMSRGQVLEKWHHNRKHSTYRGLEYLPETDSEKFEVAVKAIGGVVSRWAIDLRSPSEDKLVYMNDKVFERVTSPRAMHVEKWTRDRQASYRRFKIGDFIMQYAVSQDLSHFSQAVIDEFISTVNDQRRMELGNLLLKEALNVGLAPVVPIHSRLNKKGLVLPGKTNLVTTVRKFIKVERLPKYHVPLAERLVRIA